MYQFYYYFANIPGELPYMTMVTHHRCGLTQHIAYHAIEKGANYTARRTDKGYCYTFQGTMDQLIEVIQFAEKICSQRR